MAVKNVVFDFGGVVVGYDPAAYLEGLFGTSPAAGYVMEKLFKSEYWKRFDLGVADRGECNAIVLDNARADGFGGEMEYVQEHWFEDMMGTKEDTVALIRRLKDSGYRVYCLTNMPGDLWGEFEKRGLPQLFDGGVASFGVHVTKPDRRIYEILLERYGLEPGETVFLDDMEPNVRGAGQVGIEGILFTSAVDAERELERRGVALGC